MLSKIINRLARFRSYGLNRLDRKVATYLPRDGFFIELGANDGLTQSNTAYLERYRKWRGILIEPLPDLYTKCKANRPRSIVFNCACGATDGATVELQACNLMSVVRGAMNDPAKEEAWIQRGCDIQRINSRTIEVPLRRLSSIIDECGSPEVTFLSLDVEGYELEVLSGLDLAKHSPRFVLAETLLHSPEELEKSLGNRYEIVAQWTPGDTLFALSRDCRE